MVRRPGELEKVSSPGCFYITGNFVPCNIKTLRRMRTRAEQRFIAEATAPGARVLRAELFLRKVNICPVFHIK